MQKRAFIMAVLVGYSSSRREEAPVAHNADVASGSRRLRANDSCVINSFDVRFHVVLPIHFSETGSAAFESRQLHMPDGARIMTPAKLDRLLDAVDAFLAKLTSRPANGWTEPEIQKLLVEYSLGAEQIVGNYTLPVG